jgi:hypothetical protein
MSSELTGERRVPRPPQWERLGEGTTPGPRSSEVRTCRFELLGTARLAAGVRSVDLPLDEPTPLRSLLPALAERCPVLAGSVIDVEAGALTPGYVLNRNGRDFLKDADALIQPGDALLVLSSAAGG